MSLVNLYIRHSGHWERTSYVEGDQILVQLPLGEVTRDNVLREIRNQVGEECDYLLYYLTNTNDGGKVKVVLRDDADLLRLVIEQQKRATVYVINKDKNIAPDNPWTQGSRVFTSVNIDEPTWEGLHSEEERDDHDVEEDEERVEEEMIKEDGERIEEEKAEEERDVRDRADLLESLITEFSAWIRDPSRIDRIIGYRSINSESEPTHDDNVRADPDAIRNWLIPHVHLDTAEPLGLIDQDFAVPSVGQLHKGGVFKTKDDLKIAVGLHHMEARLEYQNENSDTYRVGLICKQKKKGCEFLLRAKHKGDVWIIGKYIPRHTCSVDLDENAPCQVPAMVLGAFFARRLITDGIVLKPNEMINEIRAE